MAQKRDSFFLAAKTEKITGGPKRIGLKRERLKNKTEHSNKKDGAEASDVKAKKPFDKKAYRFKKYSNKYKLEKWEDHRKKKLLRNYYKEVRNDAPVGSYKPVNFDEELSDSDEDSSEKKNSQDVPDAPSPAGRFVRHPDLIENEIKSIPNSNPETRVVHNSKTIKTSAFRKAKEEMERLKQSKEGRKREMERSNQEREQKLDEYRKKKAERFKKLSRKTKKGQPVMTGRLELLLEKIVGTK